ncbi:MULTISPECIES: DUF6434 domain-containing protein [unclassified Streptomyces]|uniref:DUF6434 domain-containing protein n=1 Tax=unclassified Streptomyces TaxID=2593676 RepID=UPI002E11EBED|nr:MULTISPECIES: DUF6434 domain-containing protein [unclassified Streptomyces]WSR22254.1 SAP domain-containing protein [Streptomyces sp. NBC_01205]
MSANMKERRPAPTPALTGAQLSRWYWTLAELSQLAREMGLSAGGGKVALTARLAAALDGVLAPEPVRAPRRAGRQLTAPVDGDTEIPQGQRCSQVLREFFVREIGPGFHFDAFMRDYVAQNAGRPLAEAVAHWHATRARAAEPQEVAAQFEFNRFLRDWHAGHPEGTRQQALAAWRAHRALPKD